METLKVRQPKANVAGQLMSIASEECSEVIEMLQSQGVLPAFPDKYVKQIKREKQAKVEHYLEVSQQEGCIIPD